MAFIPLYDDNPHRFIGRRGQSVTIALIAANVLVYLVFQSGYIAQPLDEHVLSFAMIAADFNGFDQRPEEYLPVPQYATLLTYAFLHGDFWHLAGNMLFLWVFGDNIEDAFGHWRFGLFYCLCAVGGAVVQLLVIPDSMLALVGASGAVAGVVAAYLLLYPRAKVWVLLFLRIPLHLAAIWVLGAWIAFQLWSVLSAADANIAWWTHLGGLAVGALLTPFLRRREVPLFGGGHDRAPPTGG